MKTFFDSSAFAKRFVEEVGSDLVEDACAQASELGLSVICVPEITSALNRRRREKSITKIQYTEAKRHLIEDIRDAEIIHLTHPIVSASITILEESPVRAMDALHIACALEWEAEIFVTADKKQLSAAKRAGLKAQYV